MLDNTYHITGIIEPKNIHHAEYLSFLFDIMIKLHYPFLTLQENMKNIITLFTVCMIYVISLYSSHAFAAEAKVSEYTHRNSKAPSAIPIDITKEGHIVLKAKVNGKEGNFILDTGAGINVLFKKFTGGLNDIRQQDGSFTGFRATGEEITMKLYKAKSIMIGDVKILNPFVTIIDADFGNIDGLISLTCFRDRAFTIDFKDKKIYLETNKSIKQREKDGTVVPIQLDDQRGVSLDMFTKVRVNDKLALQVALDSGAGFNVFRFNAAYMNEMGIDTSKAEKYFKKSSLNPKVENEFYKAVIKKIELLNKPVIHTGKVEASFLSGLIYDGITCVNWLGNKITIDIENKKIIVQ